MRGFAIAGSIVVLGVLVVMFGSVETEISRKDKQAQETRRVDGVEFLQVDKVKPAHIPDVLGAKLTLDAPQASEITAPDLKELSLTDRLDDFFLNNVALENLPLGQAMALLKQMLLTTDKQKALALHKFIVSLPTAALGRLVTLHSTSISYLEAVKTLASMAGCDVDLGEHRITLKVQAGPWPQTAGKRALTDMLDRKDDQVTKDSADQLAWLKRDALRIGVRFNGDGSASMTASQWETLRLMQDYRRRQELSLIPPVAVYLLPEGYLSPILQVTPQQVLQLMMTLNQQGFAAYSDVPYALLDPNIAQQIVVIARVGDRVVVSQHTTIPVPRQAEYEQYVSMPEPPTGSEEAIYSYQGSSMAMLIVDQTPGSDRNVSRIGEGEDSRLLQIEAAGSVTASAITPAMARALAQMIAENPNSLGYGMGAILQTPQNAAESAPESAATTPAGP
ncbi:hypothetical protein BGE01nite_04850 [Brevifollis gellanilyticus]|uniref:Uncharacterized protein n=2 Tax=Brevifollis gellanilyticus TaxID=748831 RepID=A0A512M367_9BACT|nr:hypothetical protein BGE01nite_04850 [Brevifollis gellanilyticus]